MRFALCFLTLSGPAQFCLNCTGGTSPHSGGVMLIASKLLLTDTSSAMAGLRQHSCLFFGQALRLTGF
jgi:hypothetical protein